MPVSIEAIGCLMSNEHLIPELAPYWKRLDFPALLSRPAAFLSIAQNNCVYTPGGKLYGERHDLRGSLPATVRAVRAARKSDSFRSFNWVGYSEYRDDYPKSALDAAQIAWDNELVPELRELVEPGDNEFFEVAFQSAFIGTQLPLELTRKRIEVIVITGTHPDWCVEGNARAARDFGYVPIVIGDATGAETVEQEKAAFERINQYFAPVITSRQFVDFLGFDDDS
jgi:nicotinamidase-related amidase